VPARWPLDAKGTFNSRLQSSRAFRSSLLLPLTERVVYLRPRRDGHVKFVSVVGSISWATGTRRNAVELNEATLHLLSYKINQDLVLRRAFHSLLQPPDLKSIYSLLGGPRASAAQSLSPSAGCRALWLQPLFLGWLPRSTKNTQESFFWTNFQPRDT